MQSFENQQAKKIGNYIKSKLIGYENGIVILLLLLIIIKSATHAPLGIFITILFLALATFYFLLAYADLDDELAGGLEIFIHKLASWSLSVSLIGILFLVQHWTFSDLFLRVGGLTLFACICAILWSKRKKPALRVFDFRYILRIIVLCTISLFLTFGGYKLISKDNGMNSIKPEKGNQTHRIDLSKVGKAGYE
jgi:hypothetical protein